MKEISRHWRDGTRGWRMHFCWLCGRATWWRDPPITLEFYTRPRDQTPCYCPTGSTTYFRLEFFGVGCWGWLSRDWTRRPCPCDRAMWLVSQDCHAEIEDYGTDRLDAEFPGLRQHFAAREEATR